MNQRILLTLLVIPVGISLWMLSRGYSEEQSPTVSDPKELPKTSLPAPELTKVTDWINSKPLKLADQKDKVLVVHFWTHGCINCIHNYPHYRAWQERYKNEKNYLMLGIHTPEFEAEKNVERIKERAIKNQLAFPIVVDNDHANWKAWDNQYWPCVYLVDKKGNIRFRWEGELGEPGFKKLTLMIDDLLKE